MDGVDTSAGAPPSFSPVDTSTDTAPVGDTGATGGGDTSATSTPASTPAAPPPIQDSFEPASTSSTTSSAPTAPATQTNGTGTDAGTRSPANTFQADRNRDTFTPATPAKGQPTAATEQPKPAEQPKAAADQPKPTEQPKAAADQPKPATEQPKPATDTKKADEKKPADQPKPAADTKKADEKKPDTKAEEKKADEKKPDAKADDKKAEEKKKSKPAEIKVDKESVSVKKEGELGKKETKKEVEKKGGAELPKARENKGPVATLAKGKTEEAKVGSDVGPGAAASGKFEVTAGTGGLDVNGSVKLDAHLLHLNGKAEKEFTFKYGGEEFKATLALAGDLKIGGDANLKVNFHVGTDGRVALNLGADGFVGAKGELKGTLKLESRPEGSGEFKPLMEGNASVSAYAGAAAGAKFNVQGDIRTGKLGFEAKAFASAGVGAGFGVDGTVNFMNVKDVAGRVGMKFLNDAGQAVNLPGATMDYFSAASRASELDKQAAPFTQKAHAIDAWNRQGYSDLLPSQQVDKALGALSYYKNYDMVDTAAGIGSKDGVIGKVDLEAAMRNESFPDEVRAAAYHLLQSGAWDRMHEGGLISKDWGNPFRNAYSDASQAHFKQQDQVELARRDMVRQSADLQRRAGGMWMEYQGADKPQQLKDLLGRIDNELGNTQQWGGVRSVRGAPYDAVAHEANLRALRQQIVDRLGGR